MGRKLLHLLNGLITCAVVIVLAIAGSYAAYSLWDNQQVYNAAESVNTELRAIRAEMGIPTLSAMEQMLEENRRAREARAAEALQAATVTEEPAAAMTQEAISAAVTPEPAETEQTPAIEEPIVSAAPSVTETAAPEQAATADMQTEPAEQPAVQVETNAPGTAETPVAATGSSPAEGTEPIFAEPVTNAPTETAAITVETEPAAETAGPAPVQVITGAPVSAEAQASTEPAAEAAGPASVQVTTDAPASAEAQTATAAPVVTGTPTATPAPTEAPDDSPFGQLKAINEDITAWLTMPGTAIDYPVLQGSTNYSYINKDVYGNFALAGSIFLDSRNSEDYTDIYSLLYGHNMDQQRMFSDVNLYKDKKFFDQYTLGMLLMPDGAHILESLSVIVISASDSGLFNPENWTYLDGEGIYRQVQENAMFTCEKGLEALREQIDAGETPRLVALSTCSDEFTDARTILLTLMDP